MSESEWTELQYYHLAELSDDFDPPLLVRRSLGDELVEVVELMRTHVYKMYDCEDLQAKRSAWYLFYRGLRIEADMRDFRMRFRPKGIARNQQVADELEVIGHRMEAHVHRARDEGGSFFALRSLWFLAYAVLKLRADEDFLEVSLANAGPDEVILENMNARVELSGSKGQLDPTRPTERMQEAGAWAELECYRGSRILEMMERSTDLKMLGDELTEVVERMRAYMRKVDAEGDALAATCTGWYLLYQALQIEADMRRFRVRFKGGQIRSPSSGWKDIREMARLTEAMERHVHKVHNVTKNPLISLRSLWFLAYAAIKLRALDSQYLDMSLSVSSSDRYVEGELQLRKDAAEQGDASAQYLLGGMYKFGHGGMPQDAAEAAKWFRRAAEQGHASAQFNSGIMYATGEGVPEDAVQSYAWFNIAAGQGDQHAAKAREDFAKFMTREDISRAQQLAREYWKAYVEPFQ